MSMSDLASASPSALVAEIESLGQRLIQVRERIGRVIFGQREVVDQALITLLAGGHTLLIGVPGLAKTRLVETLGIVLGLEDKRIQCTPDLMPADIIGSEVLEESDTGRRSFRFIKGPVFCQLLMADEINRASPRTQSALLQAMQEGRVSVAGQYHPLPKPFHVLATQNPLEQEGTYPLPEAQLDRFLLQIDVGYPDLESERQMLIVTTGLNEDKATPVFDANELLPAQRLVRRIPVGESVVEAILKLVRSGRPGGVDARRGQAHRLGSGPAREPGAHPRRPRPRPHRRAAVAVGRRCRGPGAAGAAASHGADLRGARRRRHHDAAHRPAGGAAPLMAEASLLRQHAEEAAGSLPPLLVAAERVAATVAQGVHGRRRIGTGETFWQFRQYEPGDPAARIDWRESAKSQRLYVRETEWEAAQSVFLWRDGSASMDYASTRGLPTKRERADLLTLALAVLLVRGGERVALLGRRPAGGAWPRRARPPGAARRARRGGRQPARLRAAAAPRPDRADRRSARAAGRDRTRSSRASPRAASRAISSSCSTPARRRCPSPGACASKGSSASSRSSISRVETVRETYIERLQRHREGLAAIARGAALELRHPPHRPAAAHRAPRALRRAGAAAELEIGDAGAQSPLRG